MSIIDYQSKDIQAQLVSFLEKYKNETAHLQNKIEEQSKTIELLKGGSGMHIILYKKLYTYIYIYIYAYYILYIYICYLSYDHNQKSRYKYKLSY